MGLKKSKDSYMDNQFITKITIPTYLAESCWKLAGGNDASYLNEGVIAAIKLAHERSLRNNYDHEQLV